MSFTVHHGDALSVLRTMPDESVHCCVTSPPFYGLRDYGVKGQIGLESTPEAYVARLVEVFEEVRRVLRPDGTCWVNLGDSYSNDTKWGGSSGGKNAHSAAGGYQGQRVRRGADCDPKRGAAAPGQPMGRCSGVGLKPKDLIGIPWRVAFALQAAGWWLRSDIIWHKPNPMPESVTDRPTKAHEYLFLLAKSERYYYDHEAIKEEQSNSTLKRFADGQSPRIPVGPKGVAAMVNGGQASGSIGILPNGRNKCSVWTLTTMPTPEAHFATFPIELPELCIKAGCPPDGVVLDPFSGAGTTGLACLKNGRRYVGIELNAEYIEISNSRARKYYPLLIGASA